MVYHGGNLIRASQEFNIPVEKWIDLSTGINPFAYPFSKISPDFWQRLPDQADVLNLHEVAKQAYKAPSIDHIHSIPGTQALLNILPQVLKQKGAVRILGPTYQEHLAAWQKAGRDVLECAETDQWIEQGDICILVNPDNPTGRMFKADEIIGFAQKLALKGGFLVVDSAFADCYPELESPQLFDQENLMMIRSFGKFYGLAGVRLGFVLTAPQLINDICEYLGPWSVSGPALSIGAQALKDESWKQNMIIRLKQKVVMLDRLMTNAGLCVEGGTLLFRFCRCENGRKLYEKLGENGILVRPFEDFPNYIRIGLPQSQDHYNILKISI